MYSLKGFLQIMRDHSAKPFYIYLLSGVLLNPRCSFEQSAQFLVKRMYISEYLPSIRVGASGEIKEMGNTAT